MRSDGTAVTSEILRDRGILHGFFGDGVRADEIAEALEVEPSRFHQCTQVHGAKVYEALAAHDEAIAITPEQADALVSRDVGLAVGVRTADCVPVLMANLETGQVAAVHAGWRGLVHGVVEAGWNALGGAGVIAIGPHIGPCCFEVSEDVAEEIAGAAHVGSRAITVRHTPGKAMVDLGAAVQAKLIALGASPKRVDRLGHCTKCDPQFPSYRRDGVNAGRMVSAIASRIAQPDDRLPIP